MSNTSTHAVSMPTHDLLPRGCIWTPEIEKVLEVTAEQIRLDLPGMLIGGRQRNGKSEASKYVAATLPTYLGYPLGVVRWTIAEDSAPSNRCFYQERLLQSGNGAITHRDIGVLRGRLFDHLASLAESKGARRLVTIIDEAQNLTRAEFGQLVYVFNELERRDIAPFMLLIGQPELLDLSTRWLRANTLQYLGRFCSATHEFLGIAMDDIHEVLRGFDDEVEGPDGCAAYRTSPGAFADGWRVNQLADVMRTCIESLLRAQDVAESSGVRIPMQHLRSFLAAILYRLHQDGIDPRLVPEGVVMDCLRISKFSEVLRFYVAEQKQSKRPRGPEDVA